MSDVSKTNDELEKLALAAEDAAGGPPSAEQVDALIEYADALRDALEAATRVPVQGEHQHEWYPETSPPRMTCGCDAVKQVEGDREALKKIIDRVDDGDWGNIFPEERDEIADAILAAGFSRASVPDAATEAIERVRAIHNRSNDWVKRCASCDEMFPCPTVAALDGAPEPEEKP